MSKPTNPARPPWHRRLHADERGTLGILLLFINAFTLCIADKIFPPFEVSGFWTYLGSVIIIWLVNMIVYGIFRPENRETKRELTA